MTQKHGNTNGDIPYLENGTKSKWKCGKNTVLHADTNNRLDQFMTFLDSNHTQTEMFPIVESRSNSEQIADFLRLLAQEVERKHIISFSVNWGGQENYNLSCLDSNGKKYSRYKFKTRRKSHGTQRLLFSEMQKRKNRNNLSGLSIVPQTLGNG